LGKVKNIMWRCVCCNNRYSVVGKSTRVLFKGKHLILCNECDKKFTFYSTRGYIRAKKYQTRWKHQQILTDTLVKLFGKKYIVDEVRFPKWAKSDKGGFLSFDVAIPSRNLLIDYHGEGHWEFPNRWCKTRADYEEQVKRDKLKLDLAPKNGWNYLVFNYLEDVGNIEWVKLRLRCVGIEVPEGK